MANGDYWNRGRRREGFQQSSSLDTLERLLGIGSNIAGKVQANRDRKQNYHMTWLTSLTSGFESNYSTDSISTMLERIGDFKKNRMNELSADTIDLIQITENNLKDHKQNLVEYDSSISGIEGLHNLTGDWTTTMADYSLLDNEKDRAKFREDNWGGKTEAQKRDEMHGYMVQYGKNISNFFTKHGQRIKATNPSLFTKYGNIQEYMYEALDNWDKDFYVSEEEKKLILNNIDTGMFQPLEDFRRRKKSSAETLDTVYSKQAVSEFSKYKEAQDALKKQGTAISDDGETYAGKSEGGDRLVNWSDNALIQREGESDDEFNERIQDALSWKAHYEEQRANSWDDLMKLQNYYRDQGHTDPISQFDLKPPEGYSEDVLMNDGSIKRVSSKWEKSSSGKWELVESEEIILKEDKDKLLPIEIDYKFDDESYKKVADAQVRKGQQQLSSLEEIQYGDFNWDYTTDLVAGRGTKRGKDPNLIGLDAKEVRSLTGGKHRSYKGQDAGGRGKNLYMGIKQLNSMLGHDDWDSKTIRAISKEDILKLKSKWDNDVTKYKKALNAVKMIEEGGLSGDVKMFLGEAYGLEVGTQEFYDNLKKEIYSFRRKWGTNKTNLAEIKPTRIGGLNTASLALKDALKFYYEDLPSMINSKKESFKKLKEDL